MIKSNFWKKRAEKYNKTNWVKDEHLLETFLSLIPIGNSINNILEVGIGTGVVANYVVEKFGPLTGIDISKEMMSRINNDDITKIVADAHDLPFNNKEFNLIYMRNVLHYLDEPKKVFSEIRRCLKSGGHFLFSQVVPFNEEVSNEYDELISRNIHYPTISEIKRLFLQFKILNDVEYILESQSIMNWLKNTCDNEKVKQQIINKHKNSSNTYKHLVNYNEKDNDITVDIKHFFTLAMKKKI